MCVENPNESTRKDGIANKVNLARPICKKSKQKNPVVFLYIVTKQMEASGKLNKSSTICN